MTTSRLSRHILRRGTKAQVEAVTTAGIAGELYMATDIAALYIHDGSQVAPVAGRMPGRTITASEVLTVKDLVVIVNASGGAVTVTLPLAASMAQAAYFIKRLGSNTVAIAAQTGETIDGAGSVDLTTPYASRMLWSDGSNWYVIGEI